MKRDQGRKGTGSVLGACTLSSRRGPKATARRSPRSISFPPQTPQQFEEERGLAPYSVPVPFLTGADQRRLRGVLLSQSLFLHRLRSSLSVSLTQTSSVHARFVLRQSLNSPSTPSQPMTPSPSPSLGRPRTLDLRPRCCRRARRRRPA